MGLESIDPSTWNMDIMSYSQTVILWVSVLMWAIIIILGIYMLFKYLQYNIPTEIYEKHGNAVVLTDWKKSRKKSKENTEEYEILWNIRGLLPKQDKFLKWFRINKPEWVIPTRKGIAFKLLRVGDAFSPIAIANPDVKLEIMPQDLLWWFTTKIRQVNEKYNDKKWWEPYIMPFSIIAVSIICLLMIILTLDKVSGIQQFCAGAERTLGEKFAQAIK